MRPICLLPTLVLLLAVATLGGYRRGPADDQLVRATIEEAMLIVDGKYLFASAPVGTATASPMIIDTRSLANGVHTAVAAVTVNGVWHSSSPVTFTTSNVVSETRSSDIWDGGRSDPWLYQAKLQTPSTWTVEMRDEAGALFRTFSGFGSTIDLAWDGKRDNGQVAPEGSHEVTVAVNGAAVDDFPNTVFYAQPRALMLQGRTGSPEKDKELRNHVLAIWDSEWSSLKPRVILPREDEGKLSPRSLSAIRRWLATTVQYLFVRGHGSTDTDNAKRQFKFGNHRFTAYETDAYRNYTFLGTLLAARRQAAEVNGGSNLYRMVYIDTCGSAGSGPNGTVSANPCNTQQGFMSVFPLDLTGEGSSVFIGNNGSVWNNDSVAMLQFRKGWWSKAVTGYLFFQIFGQIPKNPWPWAYDGLSPWDSNGSHRRYYFAGNQNENMFTP